MPTGPSYDVQLQKFRSENLRLQKYDAQVAKAEKDLPKKKAQIDQSLVQSRTNVATLRDYARKEAGQKGKVDGQVRDQMAKIDESARNLAKQAREGRANISKWRMASFEAKRMAVLQRQYAVTKWFEHAILGLRVLKGATEIKAQDVMSAIGRSSRSLQLALMGLRTGKYKVIYPTLPVVSDSEMFPGTGGIEAADKRIGKIREAKEKLEGQIGEHAKKIDAARKDLLQRRTDYHGKIDDAVNKRVAQIKEWEDRVAQLEKAKVDAEKREQLLVKERARIDQAKGAMRRGAGGVRRVSRPGGSGRRRTPFSR